MSCKRFTPLPLSHAPNISHNHRPIAVTHQHLPSLEFSSVKQPFVSVVLCAYNAQAYLREAMDSILAQSMGDKLELIVVDDGSTDATPKILQSYSDPRILLLSQQKNMGLTAARNLGIKSSRGRFIAFMDADDIAYPDWLERQVTCLEELGVDVCGTQFVEWNPETGRSRPSRMHTDDASIRALLTVYCPLSNPTIMLRAEAIKHNGIPRGYPDAEDYALWCQLASEGCRFAVVDRTLLRYRVHQHQISVVKRQQAEKSFQLAQYHYVRNTLRLGTIPTASKFVERWRIGLDFMSDLNRSIGGIGLKANSEIWARFQPKYRGSRRLLVPVSRLERWLVAFWATRIGQRRN